MHNRKSIIIAICTTVALLIQPAASLFAQSSLSVDINSFVSMVLDNSTELQTAQEEAELAEDDLESIQISGGSEFDIEEGKIAAEVSQLNIPSIKTGLILDAVSAYINVHQADRSMAMAKDRLGLKSEIEVSSRKRMEEGVRTEEEYLEDHVARLSAEIAVLSAENRYQFAVRQLLRLVSKDPESSIMLKDFAPTLSQTPVTKSNMVRAARKTSADLLDNKRSAALVAARFNALSKLGASVSEREIETLERSKERAELNLKRVENSIEDQAWDLINTYSILLRSMDVTVRENEIAEKRLKAQQERLSYGIIQETALKAEKINYDSQIADHQSSVEELYLHYLNMMAFMGADLLPLLR